MQIGQEVHPIFRTCLSAGLVSTRRKRSFRCFALDARMLARGWQWASRLSRWPRNVACSGRTVAHRRALLTSGLAAVAGGAHARARSVVLVQPKGVAAGIATALEADRLGRRRAEPRVVAGVLAAAIERAGLVIGATDGVAIALRPRQIAHHPAGEIRRTRDVLRAVGHVDHAGAS